jgi:hypothetical protein
MICGRLLQVVSEEQAFWVLVQLLETRYYSLDYFQKMIGAQVDASVVTELMRGTMP